MFEREIYIFVMLTISGGLLGLLGSVGIFVSLIVQRRVEKLQDILEELIDKSHLEDKNLSSQMYQLVQKYQMHYLLPDSPTKTVVLFINITTVLVLIIWIGLHITIFSFPFQLKSILYTIPPLAAVVTLFLFRKLLKNAINPLDNPLLNGIIPPPDNLRSVSFLSSYVNISVKALLKQARFILVLNETKESSVQIFLKEELSFDDFSYFIRISNEKKDDDYFIGFGSISFSFKPDKITGKPIPLKTNINIPLGYASMDIFKHSKLTAEMLVFCCGEKYPIQYNFVLDKQDKYFISVSKPEITLNYNIIHRITSGKVYIVENNSTIEVLDIIAEFFERREGRYYLVGSDNRNFKIKKCSQNPFVS